MPTNQINLSLFFILACIIFYLLHAYSCTIFIDSTNLGGMEEMSIYYSKILREKGSLYFDTYHFPYSQTLYTPLYFYLTNLVQDIFNIPSDDIRGYYISGRAINVIFIALSAVLMVLLAKIKDLSLHFGLFSACFILLQIPEHSLAARPDAMKDFLFILSILMLVLYQKHHKAVWWWSSIVCSIMAVYVKQDAIIYLSALWFALVVLYSNRWLIYGMIVFWTITILIAFIIQFTTNGYFFENIIFSNVEFSMDFLPRWWRDLQTVGAYSLLPVLLIIYVIFRYRDQDIIRWSIISLLFGVLAILTSIKFGAAINYFTTYFIVLSLTTGMALKSLYDSSPSNGSSILSFFIMLLILLCNVGAMDKMKTIRENEAPSALQSIEAVSHYLISNHPEEKVLVLDQAFTAIMPYETMFKGFHLIFYQLLFSKFAFNGSNKLSLTTEAENIQLEKIISEVDCLVLEDNWRSDSLYNQLYSSDFAFTKELNGYNIYLKR